MRLKILDIVVFAVICSLLILGCVERGNVPTSKQTPVVTPTEEEIEQMNQKGKIPTPKLTETTKNISKVQIQE